MRLSATAMLFILAAADQAGPPKRFEVSLDEPLLAHLADGLSDASVGEWAAYELRRTDGRASYWRLAAVGEEIDQRGRAAMWIEMEVGEHVQLAAPLAQIKMLVAKRRGWGADAITRLIVAVGADRPQEVPPDSLIVLRRELPTSSGSSESQRVNEINLHSRPESPLMTPAGTIRCTPIEVLRGGTVMQRIWISQRVPLLHLAKLEVPATGRTMMVAAFGKNAAPRIFPAGERSNRIGVESTGGNTADAGQ